MKRTLAILVLLFSILSLMSCSKDQTQTNDMPDMKVKAENWNTSIRLVDDAVLSNSHKNDDIMVLRVENLSNAQIDFPNDFGVKIITKNGQDWLNISNDFQEDPSPKVLPTKASWPLGLIVNTSPFVSDLSSPIAVRIIIIGHAENNDNELLGAYLDVKLNP